MLSRWLQRLAVVWIALAATAAAAQGTFPDNEDLRHFGAVGQPRLSPDGRRVLYRVTESTAAGGRSHLWTTDTETNEARQLTFSPAGIKLDTYRGEADGDWTPDGDILFLAKRGEHRQLYRLSREGGEAQPADLKIVPLVIAPPDAIATTAPPGEPEAKKEPQPIDVAGYEVSPDGKRIAVLAEDPESPVERKQRDDKADARWVDHEVHGTWLFLLDPSDGKLTRTAVPPDVRTLAWSPDATRLLVVIEAKGRLEDLGPARKAFLVDAADPETVTEVKQLPPTIGEVEWAKDGQSIFFHAQAERDAPPGYLDLYALELRTRSGRNLTRGFHGSVGGAAAIALRGGGLVQLVGAGVRASAIRVPPGGGPPLALEFPASVADSFHTNASQSGWVYLGAGSRQPWTLYYAPELPTSPRALATPALTPEHSFAVESKLVRWASDKLQIEGLLSLPPAAAAGKVPLIVDVHGGPAGAWQDSYSPFVNFLVGQGWAVFRPNVRGSSHYGVEFVAANKNDLGGGDYRDLMAGVDYVLQHYPLDGDRLGLYGYSYGGEMAGFVAGKTSRFKAIVSAAPVIDQYSEYGTEDSSWYDRWYFGKPWERPADAWRQSPLAGAAHASTPFLLLQGESDTTDPPGQSQEMYRALRQSGVPVELVTYPRDDHGALARAIAGYPTSEPWHGFDARRRLVEFFQRAFEPRKEGARP